MTNGTERVGFVSTNSIRAGKNRAVVDALMSEATLTNAWSDEPWIVDGAAVRVSLLCFSLQARTPRLLDGLPVSLINADLTASPTDVTVARKLATNANVIVHGSKKIGRFDMNGQEARSLLVAGGNPNGRPNSDVIKPCWNGADITGRNRDRWIIDFGMTMTQMEAAQYEQPFRIVTERVKPERLTNRNPELVRLWWLHGGPRPALRDALPALSRVVATPAVAKHRVWVWIPKTVLPDAQLMVALRDDDLFFGIVHSRFHEVWSLKLCSWMGVGNDPRYTPTTCFGTFPFPFGLAPNVPAESVASDSRALRIAGSAQRLTEMRDKWLNPAEWTDTVPEVVPGYPDRVIAKPGHEADLKKRTLTNLYNAMPTWLQNAHRDLDQAVAAAYGWNDYTPDMADEEILRRLLALNLERAASR
jgi:type II restriction/modification system DNA methylase subunit YeeA